MDDIKTSGRERPVPKSVVILISALMLSIIPLVILVRWLLPGGGAQPAPAKVVLTPLVHNPDQEIIISADQVTLYVPKNAIDLSGSFVIEPRQDNLFSYASEPEWTRPIVVDVQYRNADGVHFPGVTFSEPITICFILTPEQWTDFTQRPEGYQVQYFDNRQIPNRWVAYPMATYPDEAHLCTQTDHLSIYALAVKEQEVIPITGPTIFPTVVQATATTPTAGTNINSPEESRNRDREATLPPVNTQPPNPTKQPPRPTNPPPTDPPPATDPPATDPPATDPPATEPPATEPPATEPPVEPPPTEEPPIEEPPPPPIDPPVPPVGPPDVPPNGPPDDPPGNPPKGPPKDPPRGPKNK